MTLNQQVLFTPIRFRLKGTQILNKLVRAFRSLTTQQKYWVGVIIDVAIIFIVIFNMVPPGGRIISPFVKASSLEPIQLNQNKKYEVFGFLPYWNLDKTQNINFSALTTLAYFGIEVDADGNLLDNDGGFTAFNSKQATEIFREAHRNGTRVVLTLTQMDGYSILALMDNPNAWNNVIDNSINLVKQRGIDGINIDFEYGSNPGQDYRDKFSRFTALFSERLHKEVPGSHLSVSVYASAAKDPKIYDLTALWSHVDAVFMMAYDFAILSADNAMPTSPLYGHSNKNYWYDISTAVRDFLTQMPSNKLILGMPWYGYDYVVYEPTINAPTRPWYSWQGQPLVRTYEDVRGITSSVPGIGAVEEGWDDLGKVAYKKYYVDYTDTWRMVFFENPKSVSIKIDFAKQNNLAGVGMWAMGMEKGRNDLWDVIKDKIGEKLISTRVVAKEINEAI